MELEQTKQTKYKIVIPTFKRDFKLNLNGFKCYTPTYEYFYFETYAEAEKHLNLLSNSDKCFIVGV
jgi:predicted membrane-bound spermidine synthase